MQNQLVLKLLVSAIALAAASAASAAPASNATDAFVSLTKPQHATVLHKGEVVTGPLAPSQAMNVVVSLKLQNQDKLNSFIATAAKAGTPIDQRSMTPEAFAAQYAPTQAQADAVAKYLSNAGFNNVTIAPNRQLVTASATADTVSAAFHTSFESVHAADGRTAFHNTSDVLIPSSLKDSVLAVVGLDTVHISHILAQRKVTPPAPLPPNPGNTFLTSTAVGHEPADFATIYGASTLAPASNMNVGIITAGSLTLVQKDLVLYAAKNNITTPINNHIVQVGAASTDISGDLEWDMDSQTIVGMSGGVNDLVFYNTTSLSDADLTADYNRAVTDNYVRAINVSLGECETDANAAGTAVTQDQIFQQAAAQGITYSVSSGDSGANECGLPDTQGMTPGKTPSWPASSQYVVAVGGTEVYTTATGGASGPTWVSEVVWNNKIEDEGATGGSASTFEQQPSWQHNVGQNTGHTSRGVPDIAFDGSPDSGALVIVDGAPDQQIGGTSLSSPLFVGAWARLESSYTKDAINQFCSHWGNYYWGNQCVNFFTQYNSRYFQLPFAAVVLYNAPASNFQDITSGENGGETAAVGWDYTSGYGSPIIGQMRNHLAQNFLWFYGFPSPSASFSDTTDGLTATFTDASTDSADRISGYSWNFSDGTGSNVASPSHKFANAGTYNVTETITAEHQVVYFGNSYIFPISSSITHQVKVDTKINEISPVPLPAVPTVPTPPTPPTPPLPI